MGASPRGRDVPLDLFAQAEQLNEVSRAYEVEIGGVPLQQMTTAELTLSCNFASRGLPSPSHARGELIAALAKDETDRALRRSGDSGEADRGVVPGAGDFEEFNPSDEGHDPADPDSYLVGATCVVSRASATSGGLTPEGEFVESTTLVRSRPEHRSARLRRRPRTSASHLHATDTPKRTSRTTPWCVFGGQGQSRNCFDDLWPPVRFRVHRAGGRSSTSARRRDHPPSERTGHCAVRLRRRHVRLRRQRRPPRPGRHHVRRPLRLRPEPEREWLTIDARWRRPAGGHGCAMTSVNGVLYVLSPSDTCMEMLVWCLQLSAKGVLRWTQVPRSGQVPSPRRLRSADARRQLDRTRRPSAPPRRRPRRRLRLPFPDGRVGKVRPGVDTDPRFRTLRRVRRRRAGVAPRETRSRETRILESTVAPRADAVDVRGGGPRIVPHVPGTRRDQGGVRFRRARTRSSEHVGGTARGGGARGGWRGRRRARIETTALPPPASTRSSRRSRRRVSRR